MAASADADVPRWEAVTKVTDEDVKAAGAGLRTVACAEDLVVTASSRPVVKVWQVAEAGISELRKIKLLESHGAVGSSCVEISRAGDGERQLLAVCYDDGGIGLWDLRTQGPVGELAATVPQALKARFLPGQVANRLVSGGPSGTLCFWDLRKPGDKPEAEMGALSSTLIASKSKEDWDPESKRRKIEVKDGKDGFAAREARHVSSPIFSLAVSRDGSLLSCGRADGKVSVMRLDGREWARDVKAHWHPGGAKTAAVRALNFDFDSRLMLSGGDDGHVCMLDASTWAARRKAHDGARLAHPERFCAHRGWVTSVSLCPDPRRRVCVTTSWDRTVKLWDFATHSVLHTYKEQHSESVFDSAFSTNGRFFVSVGVDAGLCLYVAQHEVSGSTTVPKDEKQDVKAKAAE